MISNITKQTPRHKKGILSPIILSLIFIFIFIFQIVLTKTPDQTNPKILGTISNLYPVDIIEYTNNYRNKNGLKSLKPNQKLAQAAEAKAEDMFKNNYWDHFSPNNIGPWDFILAEKYDYHFAGENLAKDFNDSNKLVNAWINSPPHKANILNKNYQDIGIAVVEGELNNKKTILVVQMFGTAFDPKDYKLALDRQENLSGDITIPELNPNLKSIFTNILENKFMATKIFSVSIILIIIFNLGIHIGKRSLRHQKFELTRQHWGHIIFLIALGIMALITRDGNII